MLTSAMMLVVITTISFMVHLYSNGYMRDHHGVWETGFQRFYAFLSLFSFSMLGLVVATNIFQMYIFWELVGASSYLLIGFYYTKPSAVSASKKAFIVTRFADLGFLIGILVLSFYVGFYGEGNITDAFTFTSLTSVPVDGIADTYQVSEGTASMIKNLFTGSAAWDIHRALDELYSSTTFAKLNDPTAASIFKAQYISSNSSNPK